MRPGPLVDPADVPPWLRTLVEATGELDPDMFRRFRPAGPAAVREAAVLILLGDRAHDQPDGVESGGAGCGRGSAPSSHGVESGGAGCGRGSAPSSHGVESRGTGCGRGSAPSSHGAAGEPDVLLLRRADGLGSHAGQVAFPGGAADDGDDGPIGTALREANEETGVLADGVRPVSLLPQIYVPVSRFLVTPVLAHWTRPCPVRAVDPAETAAVARVPLRYLADPANRFRVRHPSGTLGPAFAVPDMLVWGFTAALLTLVISLGGWERPWDTADVRDLDVAWRSTESSQAGKG